jgi:subtilisin family serine protease
MVKKVKPVRNEYVVVLDDDVIGPPGENSPAEDLADQLVALYGGRVRERFKHAINGFLARMTAAEAEAMSQDPLVAFVEEQTEVSLSWIQSPVTWGLDRVDQRPRTLTNTYSYTYHGAGVNVYVVDTGIMTNHTEFGGRASAVLDYIGDGRNGQDCHGHGTHVAGTIGGNTYGVAKSAKLFSVRVFNCAGVMPVGATLSAVNWITRYGRKPAVVNMSLTSNDYGLDAAITNSVNSGITYVVAAGNSGIDACNVSPARAPGTITVGATDGADRRVVVPGSWSSNWGGCLDVWAPGYNITSAGIASTTATFLNGGTSMAAPHVAGAAAIYLSAYPTATPLNVRSAVVNTATSGLLAGIGAGSPNKLLYSLLQY